MKNKLKKSDLVFTLKYFSDLMNENCEYFAFYGTMLGLVREGSPIKGDDDVDFFVNKKHYNFIKNMILNSNIQIDYSKPPNNTEFFIQAHSYINNHELKADFYFFDDYSDRNYIIDFWNFAGRPFNIETKLKIPKPLIYPIKNLELEDCRINLPFHSEILCEYLYGENWAIPQRKGIDYFIKVIGGKPIRFLKEENLIKIVN